MRHALILPLLLLVGCSDRAFLPSWEPEPDPAGGMFTLSGVVSDSLSGAGIPRARVAAGPYVVEADGAGLWSLVVPAGPITVTTSPTGYERASITLVLVANTGVTLQPHRLAPIVQQCVREGEYVHALVSDLQGRKTVERWERSEVYILDPAGTYRVGALQWGYRALDYASWEVTLGPLAPGVTTIHWNVYDSDGNLFNGNCEPAAPPPPDR